VINFWKDHENINVQTMNTKGRRLS